MLLKTLAKALLDEFSKTEIAYTDYLEGGQTYDYACILWLSNSRIVQLVSDYSNYFEASQKENIAALVDHLKVWQKCWIELDASADFEAKDTFVFQNDHRFPREQANNFITYLRHNLG
ncbi:MAG: hypothetical protein P8H98_05115 [Flavobacteriales bacterium]|nr:hypothetical protein [Flavobacteriales bacterium]